MIKNLPYYSSQFVMELKGNLWLHIENIIKEEVSHFNERADGELDIINIDFVMSNYSNLKTVASILEIEEELKERYSEKLKLKLEELV